MTHTHRRHQSKEPLPFWHCVCTGDTYPRHREEAHGGYSRRDTCRCGAIRHVNCNGGRREYEEEDA